MGAWYGSKATSGLCQALIAAMPPHATYIECCFQLFFVGFVPDSAVTKWLGNRTNLEWQAEATARQVAYSV